MSMVVLIFGLAFVQNISFTLTSRARNRDSMHYHMWAAVVSNSVWFLTFRELVLTDMSLLLFVPYVAGTVVGSLLGARISMKIEALLGAKADTQKEK